MTQFATLTLHSGQIVSCTLLSCVVVCQVFLMLLASRLIRTSRVLGHFHSRTLASTAYASKSVFSFFFHGDRRLISLKPHMHLPSEE